MGALQWVFLVYRSGAIVSGQIGGFTMFQVLRAESPIDAAATRRKHISCILRSSAVAFLYAALVGATWPLIFFGFIFWRIVRDVRTVAKILVAAMRHLSRPAPMALQSASGISWRDRGLIVLLRARYLRSLIEGQEDSRPYFITQAPLGSESASSRCSGEVGVAGEASHDSVVAVKQDIPSCSPDDMEHGEATSRGELASIVAKVTEIYEEGIFRKVILYV